MANSYKNILITPNTGSSTDDPKIQFAGGDNTVNTDIVLRVYPTNNGTLSFEGSAGQLFSVANDLTGVIYSVNDVSGIPSIEVNADGTINLAEFGGNVGIGNVAVPTQRLHVAGNVRITGGIYDSTNAVGVSGYVLTATGSGIEWKLAAGGAGTSGSSGYSGTSGYSGFSGYSGVSGSTAVYTKSYSALLGDNAYLQIPNTSAFQFGTGNFTIECWVYLNSAVSVENRQIWYNYSSTFTTDSIFFGGHGSYSGKVTFWAYNANSSAPLLVDPTVLTPFVWTHLAVVRNGNNFTLYRDGVAVSTATSSASIVGNTYTFGGYLSATSGYSLKGYLSNFRIVNGTAVYTGNFTPPTTPLTAIANTALLACQQDVFAGVTPYNSAAVSKFNPFGETPIGTSGYSGISGYSGMGPAGASGFSGYSGTAGTSGYSGAAGAAYTPTTVSYASSVTFNAASNNIFDITLTGNITIGFTGGTDAQPITLRVRQDAVGGRTVTFDSSVRLSSSIAAVSLSTAANKLDYINFRYNSADNKYDLLAYNLGF